MWQLQRGLLVPSAAIHVPSGGGGGGGDPDILTNLVSFWSLDSDGSDSHGSNTLTGVNSPVHTTGGLQGSFMDNGNFRYEISDNADLGYSGDFSVGFWIEPGWAFLNNNAYMVTKNEAAFGGNEWRFRETGTDQVAFTCGSSNTTISSGTLSNSVWNHVVGTFEASTGTMKLYINAVEDASTTGASITRNTNAPFVIGGREGTSSNLRAGYDNVMFSKETWDQTKITWLDNSGAGRAYGDLS